MFRLLSMLFVLFVATRFVQASTAYIPAVNSEFVGLPTQFSFHFQPTLSALTLRKWTELLIALLNEAGAIMPVLGKTL